MNGSLFVLSVILLHFLLSCHSVREEQAEGWLKHRRGGSTKVARVESQKFKDELTALLVDQMGKEKRTGVGLFLFRRDGQLIFAKALGHIESPSGQRPFSGTDLIPAGSSSVWVSTVVLLRLVDKGDLKLSSTTGSVMGWAGDAGKISLRGLLSMTSGLPGRIENFNCFGRSDRTLQGCAVEVKKDLYEEKIPLRKEGEAFSYGPSHIQIAMAMAEKATERKWKDIVKSELILPLDLERETTYFTDPIDREGEINPSGFEGLVINMMDFVRILKALIAERKGFISDTLVDKMMSDQFSTSTLVDASPMKTLLGKNYHFGLGNWIECEPGGKEGCSTLNARSCPGVFGWYPFVDFSRGYYGVLAALEGHDRLQKQAEPALRSWRILNEVRVFLQQWNF